MSEIKIPLCSCIICKKEYSQKEILQYRIDNGIALTSKDKTAENLWISDALVQRMMIIEWIAKNQDELFDNEKAFDTL